MRRRFFYLLLLSISYTTASACINEYHVSVNKAGRSTESYDGLSVFYRGFHQKDIKEYLDHFDLKNVTKYSFEEQSDIAANLMKLGLFEEARNILFPLSKLHPNEYNVIINLGTVYELLGKNDSALAYIKKAMALNSESHHGSEWFHVRVLEAKLKMAGSPNWLLSHRVLGLGTNRQLGNDSLAIAMATDTIEGISYQLEERIPFTATPNLLMANVLDEFGDYLAQHLSMEDAYIVYRIAGQYDTAGVYKTEHKAQELIPRLQKAGLSIPDYQSKFTYPDDYTNDIRNYTKTILRYLNYGSNPQVPEQKKEETKSNNAWIPMVAGVVIGLLLLVWASRKRKG